MCEEKPLPTEEESDKAIVEAEARRDLNDHPPISFAWKSKPKPVVANALVYLTC